MRSNTSVRVPPQLGNEGQRQLAAIEGTLDMLAKRVSEHTSRQTILDWRNGVRLPDDTNRAQLYAAFGIPIEAWDKRASGPLVARGLPPVTYGPPPTPPRPPAPPEPEPVTTQSTMEDCLQLLAIIKRDRTRPDLMPGERVKLVDSEAKILRLRAALEARAELSEDRYVRTHPAWVRTRNIIAQTLRAHPAAAAAVAEALERCGL